MLREMTDSRLKLCEQLEVSVTQLEQENSQLRETAAADKKRISMLKLELEQCVQAMKDMEMLHDDNIADTKVEEELRENEKRAVEVSISI